MSALYRFILRFSIFTWKSLWSWMRSWWKHLYKQSMDFKCWMYICRTWNHLEEDVVHIE